MIKGKEKNAHLSDEELLQGYKTSGNQEMLSELYFRYINLVFGVCLKYLKDYEASKDAMLSIYEELVQKAKIYEIASFKSWIYALTRNYCIGVISKNKFKSTREFGEEENLLWDDFTELDRFLERETLYNKLENCLDKLSKEQEAAIRMFYFEKNCYNAIAKKTGQEWNRVRVILQNGKRNLKNCVETA